MAMTANRNKELESQVRGLQRKIYNAQDIIGAECRPSSPIVLSDEVGNIVRAVDSRALGHNKRRKTSAGATALKSGTEVVGRVELRTSQIVNCMCGSHPLRLKRYTRHFLLVQTFAED